MKTATLAVVTLVGVFGAAGCRSSTKPMHVYAGLDASGSARKQIGAYVLLVKSAADSLAAGQDSLTLYRVDASAQEFADGLYDGKVEETLKTVVAEVKSTASKDGTYPANFWHKAAARAQEDHSPTVILLMSDGDNDDMRAESGKQMREAAAILAKCRNVRAVVFCGASKENWETLRKTFAPLGARLHLLSPTQLNGEAIGPFLEEGRR